MLKVGDRSWLVTESSELPDLRDAKRLHLDVETTSFNGQCDGLNSWSGARVCGVAVTIDGVDRAWYVPLRHQYGVNVDLTRGLSWLNDVVSTCVEWSNQNVKFDAHFCARDGARFTGRLFDLITHAKLIDSDRAFGRGSYSLDSLIKDWLGRDIRGLEEALQPHVKVKVGRKSFVDYGACPSDIMAAYVCEDVLSARELRDWMDAHAPERSKQVWETETLLTPVLFDIEEAGMHVDYDQLKRTEFVLRAKMLKYEEQIAELTGIDVNPTSNNDCHELLVAKHGLPVLAWTKADDPNPSFDKHALAKYAEHPEVVRNPTLHQAVGLMLEYREMSTLLGTFVEPYQQLAVDGVLHPSYNQSVRTGRNSCSEPNMQQLSKRAKELVHPGEGEAFLSYDYSQIEFRLIVHYLNNQRAIDAYAADPDTDFHQWVADMCGIKRKPAKNINFAIGFGAGKRRVIAMLASNVDLVGHLYADIDRRIAAGEISDDMRQIVADKLCQQRGEQVFESYHAALSELRTTTEEAARNLRCRGYVFNAYGRQRTLPRDHAHKAFNNVIQSCAADVMKERVVALASRYNEYTRSLGLRIRAIVHDEVLWTAPHAVTLDPRVRAWMAVQMEDSRVKFKVPMRVSAGWSDVDWAKASGDDGAFEIDRTAAA